ncbi:SdrD B-like domain-containing protein [Microbacterium marmarense]|uniref:SdrD B-like domain-containing protein n=1 Tax=Microbacterium marmarense TaxID=3122051 RepID=A0ABU8LVX4_9MICO
MSNQRKQQTSAIRKVVATSAAAALALTGVVASAAPALAATGAISGVAYRDFNGNGVRDLGAPEDGEQTDVGIAGVSVVAYDVYGTQLGDTVITDDAGEYTLDTSAVADGTAVRVEFTELPEGYAASFAGDDNGTTVQMTVAGAEDVDLMINHPDDFAQANAPTFTAIQTAGLSSGQTSADAAVVGLPWSSGGNSSGNYPDRETMATVGEVGSVWGLTYDSTGNALYAAATYKRFSGLGPLGLGGIYKISDVLDPMTGAMTGAATPSEWLDVSSFIDVGQSEIISDAARGLTASPATATTDVNAFANAGKVGIGGLEVTPDGDNMILVNLYDRNLYVLDISAGTPTSATTVDFASTLSENQQPWALSIYRGDVYVGYVDTGDAAGDSADDAELKAYVVSAPLEDVVSGNAAWTNVLTADLGYTKGNSASNWGGNGSNAAAWPTSRPQVNQWNTWADEWTWDGTSNPTAVDSVGLQYSGGSWGTDNVQLYPQAILSSLAFDTEGYLNLGFADRTALQAGNRNLSAIDGVNDEYFESLASGDLLLAAPNNDGTFTLEEDGVVGDRNSATAASNDEGPSGVDTREFYNDNQNQGSGNIHEDSALGAVVTYPGVAESQSTVYDPLSGVRVSGVTWFDTADGSPVRGYEHTADNREYELSSTFQKGGGLGGLAIALLPPPAEIGDRVWFDADQNGRQDADEPSIAGAPVSLYLADANGNPTGDALSSTTTDEFGEYYFNSELWADRFTDPAADLVVVFGQLDADADVDFVWGDVPEIDAITGLTWSDLTFTDQSTDVATTLNDSNADTTTGEAPVSVLGAGMNDHTIDAGFVSDVTIGVAKELSEDSAAAASGQTFEISVTVEDFRGDALPDSPYVFDLAAGGSDEFSIPAFGTITKVAETNGAEFDFAVSPTLPAAGVDGLDITVTNTITTYAVGDYVWIDEDRDGLQDDGEAPLAGVAVRLLDGEGNPVLDADDEPVVTTTDAEGFYLFDDLMAGDYQVEFALTEEQSQSYIFTQPAADGIAENSDATPTEASRFVGRSDVFTLDADNEQLVASDDYTTATVNATAGIDPTWDAGVITRTYAVGDVVWLDNDRDGSQGESEAPVGGVSVALLDGEGEPVLGADGEPLIAVTDDDGRYLFDELEAGEYQVQFTLTEQQEQTYRFTTQDADGVADSDNSDPVVSTGRTAPFTLGPDSTLVPAASYEFGDVLATEGIDPTWDAGLFSKTYAVGDYVWIDENRDGVQDADELMLEGVTVNLYGVGTEVLATTTTDENGLYVFDALAPGSYRVEFVLTSDQAAIYTFTTDVAGDDVAADSNANDTAGADFGFSTLFTLGDDNEQLVASAEYLDADLIATEGIDPTWDAGVVRKKVSVGDYVWLDADGDGVQGTSDAETPIEGVKLVLTGPDGNPVVDIDGNEVAPVFTDENGFYEFVNLPALPEGESYTVTIDQDDASTIEALTELRPVPAGAGDDSALDSSTWTEDSGDLVNNGDRDSTLDFGFMPRTYAIGDVVWIDENRDGAQTDGELPLAGVTVTLLDAIGMPIEGVDPVVTDENGLYLFDELAPGKYQVEFTLTDDQKALYTFTEREAAVGGAEGDSNADAEGRSSTIKLGEGSDALDPQYGDQEFAATEGVDPTWDAGVIRKKVSVGDYVWLDADRDGVQGTSPLETPIEGVKLVLTGPDGNPVVDIDGNEVAPVYTDENGFYEFVNLPALPEGESYTVTIDQEDASTIEALTELRPAPAGAGDSATDSSDWAVASGDLTDNGDHDGTLDFGFMPRTYAIGDIVWIDADKDGEQDSNEHTLDGVGVTLYNSEGTVVATTTTDDNGLYMFDNLMAGEYTVKFTLTDAQQKIYAFTTQGTGSATDSDADTTSGLTATIVLGEANTSLTLDYAAGTVMATEGIDPTWDAGVIVLDVAETPDTPTIGELPLTGSTFAAWGPIALTLSILLFLVGGWMLLLRRRTHTA